MSNHPHWQSPGQDLLLLKDTCNVYILRYTIATLTIHKALLLTEINTTKWNI